MKVNHFHCVSKGIYHIDGIEKLLGSPLKFLKRHSHDAHSVVCWGYKSTSIKAEKLAKNKNLNLVRLEDGFVTSVPNSTLKTSICIDYLGMHYSSKSSLHELCMQSKTETMLSRADAAIRYKNKHHISKYNDTPVTDFNTIQHTKRKHILIVDQISDDESVKHSKCDIDVFKTMIMDALEHDPEAKILINKHPDNRKKTPFSSLVDDEFIKEIDSRKQVYFIQNKINPIQLLKQVDEVFTISSLLGFEAVLLDKEVHVYGTPFYSGYGLTNDKKALFRECKTKEELFYSAYIQYCKYINPISGERCQLEDVLELIECNQKNNPHTQIVIQKPSLWKRKFLSLYLDKFSILPPVFNSNFYNAEWGFSSKPSTFYNVEDGFVRSRGLGSSLTPPLSLAIDSGGIYYDHNSDSDLQKILNHYDFSNRVLLRANKIHKSLIEKRLTKYNISDNKQSVHIPSTPYVLVPGQIESDKSIIASGSGFKNYDAVMVAKERYPEHKIVYRPHPDITFNNVVPQDDISAKELADITTSEGNIIDWIEHSSAVITITSNTGFEALIRGIPVYCLGYPYYFGYGLTESEVSIPSRKRKINLTMLIASVLVLYPTYFNYKKEMFCRIEETLDEICNTPVPKSISSNFITRLGYKLRGMM